MPACSPPSLAGRTSRSRSSRTSRSPTTSTWCLLPSRSTWSSNASSPTAGRRPRWCSSTPAATRRPRSRWRRRSPPIRRSCWPWPRRSGTTRGVAYRRGRAADDQLVAGQRVALARIAAACGRRVGLWRRFVPDRRAASLLAEIAGSRSAEGEPQPVCLVDDGSRVRTRVGGAGRDRPRVLAFVADRRVGGDGGRGRGRDRLPRRRVGRLPTGCAGIAPGRCGRRGRPAGARRRRRGRAQDDDPADVSGRRRRGGGIGRVLVRRRLPRPSSGEPSLRERLSIRARVHAGCLRRGSLGRRPPRGRRDHRGRSIARRCERRSTGSRRTSAWLARTRSTTSASSSRAEPGCFAAAGTGGSRFLPEPRLGLKPADTRST